MNITSLSKLYNEIVAQKKCYSEREELLFLRKKVNKVKKMLLNEMDKIDWSQK